MFDTELYRGNGLHWHSAQLVSAVQEEKPACSTASGPKLETQQTHHGLMPPMKPGISLVLLYNSPLHPWSRRTARF